jgi:glycosyltransferase involved in cell wall biosynthesis
LRILVFGENLAYRRGGAEKTAYLLAQRLAEIVPGLEIVGVSCRRPPGHEPGPRYDWPTLDEIPVHWLRFGFHFLRHVLNAGRLMHYFLIADADFLLANGQLAPFAINAFPGLSAYFIHDEVSLGVYRSYDERPGRRLKFSVRYAVDLPFLRRYRTVNARAMRRASLVVANSMYMAERARSLFGVDPVVLYPQVDVAALGRTELRPVAERPYIMMVGDEAVKGLPTFLRIAEAMPSERFLVVGRRFTDDVSGNVTFRGFAPDPLTHYGTAKLLLVPSTWEEGFGMVAVEAQALGIPAIVSDRGGLPETVPSQDLVVGDYTDAAAWAEAIRAVLGNYDRSVAAAREHAARFDGARGAAKLVEEIFSATGLRIDSGPGTRKE